MFQIIRRLGEGNGMPFLKACAITNTDSLYPPFTKWVSTGATLGELAYIMCNDCDKGGAFKYYIKELQDIKQVKPYKKEQQYQDPPIEDPYIRSTSQFVQEVDEHLNLMKDITVKEFFNSKDQAFEAHKQLFFASVDDEDDGVNRLLIATGVLVKPGYLYDIIPDPTVAGSTKRLIKELLKTQWSNVLMKDFIQTLEDKLDFPEAIGALTSWHAKINKKRSKKMSDLDTQNEKHNTVRAFILDAFKKAEYPNSEKRIKPIMDKLNENGITTVEILGDFLVDLTAHVAMNNYGIIFAEYNAIKKALARSK